MRNISKGQAPPELIQHQKSPNANYENFPHKDQLRAALVAEQRGLCCYCQCRIRPSVEGMKIEHWHPQSLPPPQESINYSNLLGACQGNEGQPRRLQHCDTHKGDAILSRNPANPGHNVEARVVYLGDGRIHSEDNHFLDELEAVLNLNTALLVMNRRSTLDAFIQSIPRKGPLTRLKLNKWLAIWTGAASVDEMKPYSGVVTYWLRKKLKALS